MAKPKQKTGNKNGILKEKEKNNKQATSDDIGNFQFNEKERKNLQYVLIFEQCFLLRMLENTAQQRLFSLQWFENLFSMLKYLHFPKEHGKIESMKTHQSFCKTWLAYHLLFLMKQYKPCLQKVIWKRGISIFCKPKMLFAGACFGKDFFERQSTTWICFRSNIPRSGDMSTL